MLNSREENLKELKDVHYNYDFYGHALERDPLPERVRKFTILADLSLSSLQYTSFLSSRSRSRKRKF